MSKSLPILDIKNVSKSYPPENFKSLDDVSFKIYDEKVTVILGANGCGKSTLLQIINGTLEPDTGKVLLENEKVPTPSEVLIPGIPEIKLVNQKADINPYHSVFENIFMSIPGYAADEEKTELTNYYIDLCQLRGLETRNHFEMSGGQKQRLAIACALIQEPKILLLDEPFSNLDPVQSELMQNVIFDICKNEDLQIIFVTHQPEEAFMFATKAIIMKDGKILQEGSTKDLYSNPRNEYTARFLGKCVLFKKEKETIIIRPEHIKVLETGTFEGLILKQTRLAHFNEFKMKWNDEVLTFYECFKTKIEVNTSIKFEIDFDSCPTINPN